MFFDIGRWTKAIEKGVGKDIRKDQLIRLSEERTRLAMADAMRRGRYEISPRGADSQGERRVPHGVRE